MTEFADEYTKKKVEADPNNSEKLRNKLRKHNFEIGDTTSKLGNTVYDNTYIPHPVGAAPNADELRQKVVELRKTNLVLGEDPNTAASTMKTHYQKIEGHEPIKLNRAQLQKTHFDIGNEPRQLNTINRTFYKAHKHDPNSTTEMEKKVLMDDLRSKLTAKGRTSFRFWTITT
jgi:hypothetical protein